MEDKLKKQYNGWKAAFWVLVIVLIGSLLTVVHLASAPVKTPAETTAPKASDTSLELVLNQKQVNALANSYIKKIQKKSKNPQYRFIVGNQYATVIGHAKFLGVNVQYAMNCIPVKTSEGNILLKAKGLAVGRLNLPIGFVMGYIKKNYQLPNWVYINQKKKTILLDLNKYTKNKAVHAQADEINLADGQFKFLITVPQDN
ncbi:YpmS family protein [Limosilactobacillus mucosae]|uniref:YpmS family protein n=1 Tax=Limosilactobacillus mucosae TaxID=97478 RepID=UPI00403A03F5